MTAKRNFWSVGGKLCCLCIVLVPFAFAGPVKAKRTLTILPTGDAAISINDSGVVTGWEESGLGFLRTPDGTITTFKAVDNAKLTQPQWINSSGVITGYYWDNNNVIHGFVRRYSYKRSRGRDGSRLYLDAMSAEPLHWEFFQGRSASA